MNQHLSMADVIGNAARSSRAAGMSDDQRDNEWGAQERLTRAMYEMEQAIKMVNHQSSVVDISLPAWEAFVHDELPDARQWDERIERARNP